MIWNIHTHPNDADGRSLASQLAKLRGVDTSEEASKLTPGENLKRLLTPVLKDKGIKP